ncbi:hypothetical protein [Pontiella agarivorans]|uniref:DUF5060 domain-containing protein n=1 Tax=Pontiella agarivorans TaxID=3038953 RepID=A0ABU5MUA4_9BACT|nr:hypothetical protein [Pontiella agarivorans]MDZ8117760.1 hypothetical protein [Pontiella agarivorans]
MKKIWITWIAAFFCLQAFTGEIGLPTERLALPAVSGTHLVCVWDDAAQNWMGSFETYDHAGVYEFQVPEWGKWYWIGLWDSSKGEYVYGKWVGHFLTD